MENGMPTEFVTRFYKTRGVDKLSNEQQQDLLHTFYHQAIKHRRTGEDLLALVGNDNGQDVETMLRQLLTWLPAIPAQEPWYGLYVSIVDADHYEWDAIRARTFIECMAELFAETRDDVAEMCDTFLLTGQLPSEDDVGARHIEANLPSGERIMYDTLTTMFYLAEDEDVPWALLDDMLWDDGEKDPDYKYTSNWGRES